MEEILYLALDYPATLTQPPLYTVIGKIPSQPAYCLAEAARPSIVAKVLKTRGINEVEALLLMGAAHRERKPLIFTIPSYRRPSA